MAVAFAMAASVISSPAMAGGGEPAAVTATRVAVVLQPGSDAAVLDALLAAEGARLDRWLPGPRLAVASTPSPAAAARLAQVLRTHAAGAGPAP
ncbi:MAG: hypothetical protein WKG00_10780 [Polyangiaceae bacterium]